MKRIAAFLVILIIAVSSAQAGQLQAGASTSNITPELGLPIIGGFVPYPSTHVHDELNVRSIVLDDGETRLAIVVCDLLGIDRCVSDEARKQIADKYKIPKEHVLTSATHTHSASSALGTVIRKLDQTPDDYQQFVANRIADGVARAISNLRPAEISFGTVDVPEHVFNRRWHMRPGTIPPNPFGGGDIVKMNPPRGKNLVEPAGPIDPVVSFLSIRESNGKPIAVYAAYSLHYVGGVRKGHVSADYFAIFAEHLKKLQTAGRNDDPKSPAFVAMMANATSGDINNISFRKPRPRKPPYGQMRYVGEDVAEKVHGAMKSLKYDNSISLAAAYSEPTIRWRRPNAEQRKWAEDTLAAGRKSERDLSYIYAQRTMRLAEYPETTTIPLHILKIGKTCIGTMPFEVFCEIGLEFREKCPIQPAFMVELAHGYFGYLPTPRQHKLGGYETWLGTNRVEEQASNKLLSELLKMAQQLKEE